MWHLHLKRLPRISLSCKLVPVQNREYEYNLIYFWYLYFDMYNKVVFYPILTRFVPESSFDRIEYTYAGFFQDNRNWASRTVAYYFVLASCLWTCLVYTLRKVSSSLGTLYFSWTLSTLWGVKPLGAHDTPGSLCSIESWRSSKTYRSLRAVKTGRPDWALELSHVVHLQERRLQHVMDLQPTIPQGSVTLRVGNDIRGINRYPVDKCW